MLGSAEGFTGRGYDTDTSDGYGGPELHSFVPINERPKIASKPRTSRAEIDCAKKSGSDSPVAGMTGALIHDQVQETGNAHLRMWRHVTKIVYTCQL